MLTMVKFKICFNPYASFFGGEQPYMSSLHYNGTPATAVKHLHHWTTDSSNYNKTFGNLNVTCLCDKVDRSWCLKFSDLIKLVLCYSNSWADIELLTFSSVNSHYQGNGRTFILKFNKNAAFYSILDLLSLAKFFKLKPCLAPKLPVMA